MKQDGDGSQLTGLTKSQVSLGNVDNTSDADKRVSDATTIELNKKFNTSALTTHLPKDSDLNDDVFKNSAIQWHNESTGDVNSLVNRPQGTTGECTLTYTGNSSYGYQLFHGGGGSSDMNAIYMRYNKNGTWGKWVKQTDKLEKAFKFNSMITNMSLAPTSIAEYIEYNSDKKVKWTGRIIYMGHSRGDDYLDSGYLNIDMPDDDTDIPILGTDDTIAVRSGYIEMPDSPWGTMYYSVKPNDNYSTKSDRFFFVNYHDDCVVPTNAITVFSASGESSPRGHLKFADGRRVLMGTKSYVDTNWVSPSLDNSWVKYNDTFGTAQYRRVGNVVEIKGLVKDGDIGKNIFVLPEGFRPTNQKLIATQSHDDLGRLDIKTDGSVNAYAGDNAWFSVSITFTVA